MKSIVPAMALNGLKAPGIEIINPRPRVAWPLDIGDVARSLDEAAEIASGYGEFRDPIGVQLDLVLRRRTQSLIIAF